MNSFGSYLSRSFSSIAALVAAMILAGPLSQAATFTWSQTGAGPFNWDDSTSNWGSGFPNAAGDIANLTADLTAAQTINLNQAITLGTLNIGDPTTGFFAYTIAAGTAGSLTFGNNGSTATLSTTNVATGATNTISANITLADNLAASVQNTNALSISGIIGETGGARSLTKSGGAILTLTAANTYTGATNVTGGLLKFTTGSSASSAALVSGNTTTANALDMSFDNSAISSGSSITRLASITLTNGDNKTQFNGLRVIGATTNNTINSVDTITGALTVTGAAGINVAQTGTTGVGNVNFTTSGGTGTTTLQVGSISRGTGAILNVVGTLGTLGTTTLLKSTDTSNLAGIGGGGALGSTTENIVPWATNQNNGFLTYDATKGFVIATTSGGITSGSTTLNNVKVTTTTTNITADTTINSLVTATTPNTINISAGVTLSVNSGAMNFSQPDSILGGTLALGSAEGIFIQDGRNVAITSVITGTGGLTLTRAQGGTNAGATVAFAFGAANTYSGVTTLTGGDGGTTLIVGNTNALQNTTLNAVGGNVAFGTTLANQANLGNQDITTANFGGLAGTSNIALTNAGPTSSPVALVVGSDNDSTLYSGVLSGNILTGGSLNKTGTGTLTLTNANTYTGGTTFTNGSVQINNAAAVGSSGNLTFSGGTLKYGTVTTDLSARIASGTSTGAVSIDTNGQNVTFATALTGSQSGGFAKLGAGTLTFTGANTYTGGTTVSGGTLKYGNSFTMSGANQITLAATGTAGTNYATVVSSGGTLTLGGTLAINFSSSILSGGESFNLFQVSGGTVSGGFGSTTGNVSISGSYIAALANDGSGNWTGTDTNGSGLSFTFTTGTGILSVSAIPEPATYAAIFGALALAGVVWSRRRAVRG